MPAALTLPLSSALRVDAATKVTPLVSSMIWV
jgi:hypothetical protein